MNIVDLIIKKKKGLSLNKQEIEYFINSYVEDKISDYQVAALLMAICLKGMNNEETLNLTLAMKDSGDIVDLSKIPGIKVDKHSTGGVADTSTIIVAPLVAACGVKVAKMSGRGLGHTGGTLDKLESIPGFSVFQSMDRFNKQVADIGLSVIGQTSDLAPADKKLYALRDVTGTVDSLPLIASSIMSKKLASGADAIVLDVKTGSGAFMKDEKSAKTLAKTMVDIGVDAGKKTIAVVTDMNQPLGNAIGNSLEIIEAIKILKGEEEGDLKNVSMILASKMLILAGFVSNDKLAFELLEEALKSGKALTKLKEMIEAQGGDVRCLENLNYFPQASEKIEIKSEQSGWVYEISTEKIGISSLLLGAGRKKKDDKIDLSVGLWMKKRLGDRVLTGDVLAEFYINNKINNDEAIKTFKEAVIIKNKKPKKNKLVYSIIG